MISSQKVLLKEIITSKKVLENLNNFPAESFTFEKFSVLPCLVGVGGSNLRANREKEEKSDMCWPELRSIGGMENH